MRDSAPPTSATTASATCSGSTSCPSKVRLGVEVAELLGRHAVGRGPVLAPGAGEDPRTLDDAVGVHAVDPDAVLTELGRQQPHLVGLVGLGRAVGDVLGPGGDRVLRHDVDDVATASLRSSSSGPRPG